MIQKLQKLFHTDKWWGKVLFSCCFYIIYWFIFYGTWIFISKGWNESDYDIYNLPISIFLFILFIFLPIISFFFFPKLLKKIAYIKHSYFTNFVFIFLSLIIFYLLEMLFALQRFFGANL